jgi:hypothetical protein
MNSIAKSIVDAIATERSNKYNWTEWARKIMEELRNGLHPFHGKGNIKVTTYLGGPQYDNKVLVENGDQFRFSFDLKQGYIQFDHHQQQMAWAFNDPCDKTAQTLRALAIRSMVSVIAEQTSTVIAQCEVIQ